MIVMIGMFEIEIKIGSLIILGFRRVGKNIIESKYFIIRNLIK